MKMPLLCLVVVCLVASSCKKEDNSHSTTARVIYGCTDSAALNFLDSANHDNGSCTYLADDFNGIYLAYDSVYVLNLQSPPYTGADTFTFTLNRFRHDTVRLCNYVCTYDTVYFKADSTAADFSGPFCIVFGSYHFKLSHDTLYYNSYASGQGYYADIWHWGYAIKQ
jgi:hypothetical protein